MRLRIEFDPRKDATNRAKHGLSLTEVAEFTERAVWIPTYAGSDPDRFRLMDRTRHGIVLAIVTRRGERLRVISVRYPNRREVRMYEAALRNT